MIAEAHGSQTYAEALRRFKGRDSLELGATARLLARAHQRHLEEIAAAETSGEIEEREAERRMLAAHEKERFWAAVGARHLIKALIAEYALILSDETLASLQREADWFLVDLANIEARNALNFGRSIPPPAYLPCPVVVLFGDTAAPMAPARGHH